MQECGEGLKGLVGTGLLLGTNASKLRLAGTKDRTLAMSWVIADANEIVDRGIVKGPFAVNLVGNLVGLRGQMANMHNELTNVSTTRLCLAMETSADGP